MVEKDRFGRPIRPPAERVTAPLPLRIARGIASFAAALAFLWVVIASPLAKQTEMSWAVPYGLLPIALLLGAGTLGQELAGAGSPARRDGVFGIAAAVAAMAFLRLAGVF